MMTNTAKLVGVLNYSKADSDLEKFSDVLEEQNWVLEDNKYAYYYSNPILSSSYYIEMTPILEELSKGELLDLQIEDNIYMDLEKESGTYILYSKNKPEKDIKIFVLVKKLKGE